VTSTNPGRRRPGVWQAWRAAGPLHPEALDRRSLGRALGDLAVGFGSETDIEACGVVSGEQRKLLGG
jgi:hypothetical protein